MNEGKVLKGVFTPGIEETVADIHQRVEGILTESDITKNIAGSETTSWISKLKPDLSTAKGKAIVFAAGAAVVVGGVMLAQHFSQRQQPEQPAVAQPR